MVKMIVDDINKKIKLLLLKKEVNIIKENIKEFSCFLSFHNNLNSLLYLLSYSNNYVEKDFFINNNKSIFFAIFGCGDFILINELIKFGINPFLKDEKGFNAFHYTNDCKLLILYKNLIWIDGSAKRKLDDFKKFNENQNIDSFYFIYNEKNQCNIRNLKSNLCLKIKNEIDFNNNKVLSLLSE